MCLVIFRWQPALTEPLILLSNRDEFYARPSKSAHIWPDNPHILGGRDREKGGTWLAVSTQGKLACVTNYREPGASSAPRSRGEIPFDFLNDGKPAFDFALALKARHAELPGFNALLFDGKNMVYTSNRAAQAPELLRPGTYGLSNHLIDTPWPKVEKAKAAFSNTLLGGQLSAEQRKETLLSIMQDKTVATDNELPDTGVPREIEKMLSAIFINSPGYGTRTTTLVEIKESGLIELTERNYGAGHKSPSMRAHQVRVKKKPDTTI